MAVNSIEVKAPAPELEPVIVSIKRQVMVDTKRVLEAVGEEVVQYLRSMTSEVRPPARVGGPERLAHPGHWADDSGDLARGYSWQVVTAGFRMQLIFRNGVKYAAYLELMEGFFVLTGIEEPGGPIDQAFTKVLPVVAPTLQWKRR
jgi:hypothetical protein